MQILEIPSTRAQIEAEIKSEELNSLYHTFLIR